MFIFLNTPTQVSVFEREREKQKFTLRPLAVTNFSSKSIANSRGRRRKYITAIAIRVYETRISTIVLVENPTRLLSIIEY